MKASLNSRCLAVTALLCAMRFATACVSVKGLEKMRAEEELAASRRLPLDAEVFLIKGSPAFVMMPRVSAGKPEVPWVWYAPTLEKTPGPEEKWMFDRFLSNGVAVAGVNVGESYGSPKGRRVFSTFYRSLVKQRGFSKKPCLLARSRGGLMLYNWAVENAGAVGCIAGIYPVCNVSSFPGLAKACAAYGMTEQELAADLGRHNPVDRLSPLAEAGVPIYHIHGDSDGTVPLDANSGLLARRYRELGGNIVLDVVSGGGHDMSDHWFQCQALVDFVFKNAGVSVEFPPAAENLDGAAGKVFHVDLKNRSFELLKETVIDPKTNEGRSRHTVSWDDNTRFIKVTKQNSFEGIQKPVMARFRKLDDENAKAAASGLPFVVMEVWLLAENENPDDWSNDQDFIAGRFTADPDSNDLRGGTVEIDGKPTPVRLRGPRAEVFVRTKSDAAGMAKGFWSTVIHGRYEGDRFVAGKLANTQLPDPRDTDDPALPRVLVIGDSISMNYHDSAKEFLKGMVNYHRIDGNGGPANRGLLCMELWLGDYREKGLHWDLIQFNHGLHDLKQVYDAEKDVYGAYNVPIEEYRRCLEQEIQIMKRTGAKLVWCTTTPVPNRGSVWGDPPMGRQKDADMVFNEAAMEVIALYPEIEVSDVNAFIRKEPAFDKWREGNDVHFWGKPESELLGKAVAEGILSALGRK